MQFGVEAAYRGVGLDCFGDEGDQQPGRRSAKEIIYMGDACIDAHRWPGIAEHIGGELLDNRFEQSALVAEMPRNRPAANAGALRDIDESCSAEPLFGEKYRRR